MKKKFTMLFAALLACVGVMKADVTDLPQISTVENPIYYTIYNTRSEQPGGLMYYAGDNVGLKDGCTSLTLENKYKFFFTGTHEAMYIHNAATGKKLASVDSWTDAGIEWTVSAPTSNGLAFGPKGENGNVFWNDKNYGTNENTSDFTVWSATDAGSIFVVELAEDFVAPISGLFYVIEAPLFEKVQGETGKKAIYVNDQNKAVWGAEDLTNHNFYWIPTVKDDGTIALKNFGTGEYLSDAAGVMSKDAVYGNLNALGSNSFNIKIGGTLHAAGHDSGKGANGNLTSWGGVIGSASAWSFVQKNDPTALQEVVVKYSFTYGDEEKYTQETATLVGEEWPAITTAFPFGVSAEKPAGEVSAEGAVEGVVTKVIELSVNLPFTYSEDYESIENWYFLNIRDDGPTYMYYDENVDFIKATENSVPAESKDAYTWAFIGDPFTGFSIVNYEAGATMVLSAPVAPTGDKHIEALARMVEKETIAEEGNKTWDFVKPTHPNAASGAFYVQHPKAKSYAFNRQSLNGTNTVCYWTGRDTGSALQVVKRDDSETLRKLVVSAQEYLVNLGAGTSVGCVTADSKVAISDAIANANTAIENKTGYNEAQAALQAAIDAVKTIQPEEGKFYTIVSSCTKDHRAGQEIYVDKDGVMHFAKVGEVASEIARVFQFVPANDGKFYLYNIEKDAYMQSIGTATEFDVTKAKAVTIANMGKDNIVSIKPDGQSQMHAQDRDSKIVGWNESNYTDGSAWKIVETELSLNDLTHTLNVSEAGWATLVLGYNTTIPTGVKAYAVSSITEGKAVLTEVAKDLPAHTPVLIEAAAGEYEFSYTATTEATVAINLLAGSVFNMTVVGDGYVLAAKEKEGEGTVVGLYRAKKTISTDKTNDGTEEAPAVTYEAFKNNANKAYLPAPADGNAPAMFVFSRGGDDESTGIDQLINNGEVVIYDLAGRRVEKMEKGIYIVNGKKVVK